MDKHCLSILGLIFGFIGTATLSYGLIISKKEAIRLGVSRLCGETDEENSGLPQVKDRLKQSKNAIIGLVFITIGFLLQLIANW